MGKNGGARPGAGRPKAKRTIIAEMYRDYIAEQIRKHMDPIIGALIKKAIEGDVAAIKELTDRCFGKSQDFLDVTTGGDKLESVDPNKAPQPEIKTKLAERISQNSRP